MTTHYNFMLLKPISAHPATENTPAFCASFCPVPDHEGEFFCVSHIFGQAGTPTPMVMTRDEVVGILTALNAVGLDIDEAAINMALDVGNSLSIDVFADDRPTHIGIIPEVTLSRFAETWVRNDITHLVAEVIDDHNDSIGDGS